jgi:hypothetical protein
MVGDKPEVGVYFVSAGQCGAEREGKRTLGGEHGFKADRDATRAERGEVESRDQNAIRLRRDAPQGTAHYRIQGRIDGFRCVTNGSNEEPGTVPARNCLHCNKGGTCPYGRLDITAGVRPEIAYKRVMRHKKWFYEIKTHNQKTLLPE